jgi:hypothetical protein
MGRSIEALMKRKKNVLWVVVTFSLDEKEIQSIDIPLMDQLV